MECVEQTHAVAASDRRARLRTRHGAARQQLQGSLPHTCAPCCAPCRTRPQPGQKRLRLAVLNAGAPAPGMNTAVRAAVRLGHRPGPHHAGRRERLPGPDRRPDRRDGLDERQRLGVQWAAPSWAPTVKLPSGSDFYAIARTIEKHEIDGLLMIGGWSAAIKAAHQLLLERDNYPGLQHPDRLPARHDQQQPARLRAEHRRGYRAEQHRRGGGQDQAVGGRAAALLRGGGDGPQLRLSGADERPGHRRRTRVSARGRRHPARPAIDVEQPDDRVSSTANAWA